MHAPKSLELQEGAARGPACMAGNERRCSSTCHLALHWRLPTLGLSWSMRPGVTCTHTWWPGAACPRTRRVGSSSSWSWRWTTATGWCAAALAQLPVRLPPYAKDTCKHMRLAHAASPNARVPLPALHSCAQQVVNRDIKLENTLLADNNKLKLCDFGGLCVLPAPRCACSEGRTRAIVSLGFLPAPTTAAPSACARCRLLKGEGLSHMSRTRESAGGGMRALVRPTQGRRQSAHAVEMSICMPLLHSARCRHALPTRTSALACASCPGHLLFPCLQPHPTPHPWRSMGSTTPRPRQERGRRPTWPLRSSTTVQAMCTMAR